ncbi:MAG: RNA-binding protein [Proteobacteria bacterium]|nr:RNA-binding protein [Pseudomonadota bacterium]
MEKKLYVGNLPYSANDATLNELFSKYGEVVSAKVITDADSGRSKGFGFIEMSTAEEAQKAIEQLNDKELDGRNIKVNEAKPKTDSRSDRGPKRW